MTEIHARNLKCVDCGRSRKSTDRKCSHCHKKLCDICRIKHETEERLQALDCKIREIENKKKHVKQVSEKWQEDYKKLNDKFENMQKKRLVKLNSILNMTREELLRLDSNCLMDLHANEPNEVTMTEDSFCNLADNVKRLCEAGHGISKPCIDEEDPCNAASVAVSDKRLGNSVSGSKIENPKKTSSSNSNSQLHKGEITILPHVKTFPAVLCDALGALAMVVREDPAGRRCSTLLFKKWIRGKMNNWTESTFDVPINLTDLPTRVEIVPTTVDSVILWVPTGSLASSAKYIVYNMDTHRVEADKIISDRGTVGEPCYDVDTQSVWIACPDLNKLLHLDYPSLEYISEVNLIDKMSKPWFIHTNSERMAIVSNSDKIHIVAKNNPRVLFYTVSSDSRRGVALTADNSLVVSGHETITDENVIKEWDRHGMKIRSIPANTHIVKSSSCLTIVRHGTNIFVEAKIASKACTFCPWSLLCQRHAQQQNRNDLSSETPVEIPSPVQGGDKSRLKKEKLRFKENKLHRTTLI